MGTMRVLVGNADEALPTEPQLYGTSAVNVVLTPGSCHPWASAIGRDVPVSLVPKATSRLGMEQSIAGDTNAIFDPSVDFRVVGSYKPCA